MKKENNKNTSVPQQNFTKEGVPRRWGGGSYSKRWPLVPLSAMSSEAQQGKPIKKIPSASYIPRISWWSSIQGQASCNPWLPY